VGKPLSEIPCPCGSHKSYSEHFLLPFIDALHTLGIKPEVFRADVLYKEGKYIEAIKKALTNRDAIAKILSEVAGRELEPEWSPYNPICNDCGRLNTTKVTSFDINKETIDYVCKCGSQGTVSMTGGENSTGALTGLHAGRYLAQLLSHSVRTMPQLEVLTIPGNALHGNI